MAWLLMHKTLKTIYKKQERPWRMPAKPVLCDGQWSVLGVCFTLCPGCVKKTGISLIKQSGAIVDGNLIQWGWIGTVQPGRPTVVFKEWPTGVLEMGLPLAEFFCGCCRFSLLHWPVGSGTMAPCWTAHCATSYHTSAPVESVGRLCVSWLEWGMGGVRQAFRR